MNLYFLTGYMCNLLIYNLWGMIVIILGIVYGKLSLELLMPFLFFYIFSVLLFTKGYKRRFLSRRMYIRIQDITLIFVNTFFAMEVQSRYVFVYGMILCTILMFIFMNESICKMHFWLSVIAIALADIIFDTSPGQGHFTVEYVFGLISFLLVNWIAISMSKRVSYQERKDYEQERSLDDLLKIIEIKCDEAREATRIKSKFLSTMSHEIRTPINGVLGMNEMILRESKETSTLKYAHDIQGAARTLLSIINEILDSSKIESGKMEIVPDNYDISSLLNDLYNMISVKARTKGLDLIFDIDESMPTEYYGDDIRIRQVLVNLLTNAVKYTQKGSVTMTVTCDVDGENAVLHYAVKDTGIGIKDEDMDKLFSEFQRIDEARNRYIEGTGLGMNITIKLLKLMGSELKVTSKYEEGSEFSFDLIQKVTNGEPLGDFKERILNTVKDTEYQLSYIAPDAKILVVDDNDVNRKVFRNLLKMTQIQVYEAGSGTECLAILEQKTFDLIFLDHMMPEMDGIETLHAIKEKNLCDENTPIVMLTANAVVGAKEQYLSEGFDDFLTKPIMPEKLDKMVVKHLPENLVREGDYEKEVQNEVNTDELPQLDEFDFDYAMNLLKSQELLQSTLEDFYKFLEQIPAKLNSMLDGIMTDEGITAYRIEVHALKSTAATVGALLLSKLARMLEVAAKCGDVNRIQVLHPILLDEIEKHRERVATILPESDDKLEIRNVEEICSFLEMLKSGLENADYGTADFVCQQIQRYTYPDAVQELVDELAAQVMNLEDEEAMVTIENIKKEIGERKT